MRALISGGGIAGPALAFWLHRHGIETTVVERAAGPRPGGHAVDIRGAARDVVERMGLTGAVLARRVDERGVALVDARGRRTAEMPADMFGGEGIVADVEISRGDLAHVLYEATAATTAYRFGDHVTALTQDPSGVDVTFAGGGTGRYDVVIGADGVHSGVRALAFAPDTGHVRYLGGYTAYFTVTDPGDLDHQMLMFNAPGGRVATLRPERGGTAKANLSFTAPTPAYDRLDPDRQRAVLAERMAGAGWRVPALLAEMPAAGDFYFASVCQVHVERWHRGRVALIGDAGYCSSPLTGLGTSMSLVGAYVLAGELGAAPGDPATAFTSYQAMMRDYVAAGLQLPPGGMAMFAPRTRTVIALRSLSWRMTAHWPMRQILARQFGKADNITLPDYPGAGAGAGAGAVADAPGQPVH